MVSLATIIGPLPGLRNRNWRNLLALGTRNTRSNKAARSRAKGAVRQNSRLDLFRFVPFRLNRLATEVSHALSSEYQERYGLDIPEWRVLATLGFRNDACSAQYVSDCTRTHKSTISRAVTALMRRKIIERVENLDDRREFRLRLTRKGRALYEELIPRLLHRERLILTCLSAKERKNFTALLGKIEKSLDLVQTSKEADAKQAY
jgi:DNA-binding MarR family transcriptional regulator